MRKPDIWNCSKKEWDEWEKENIGTKEGLKEKYETAIEKQSMEKKKREGIMK